MTTMFNRGQTNAVRRKGNEAFWVEIRLLTMPNRMSGRFWSFRGWGIRTVGLRKFGIRPHHRCRSDARDRRESLWRADESGRESVNGERAAGVERAKLDEVNEFVGGLLEWTWTTNAESEVLAALDMFEKASEA